MQIGEEGGNNPDLIDVSAHDTRVLKNLANGMLRISRKSSENKEESNGLFLGDAYACEDLREPFPPSLESVNITGQGQEHSYKERSPALWVNFTSFVGSFV